MEIVSLEGKTRPDQVNKSIVEMLSEWLEDAKAGKFKAVAIAAVTEFGSQHSASKTDCKQQMIGALAMLQFYLMKKYDEDDEG